MNQSFYAPATVAALVAFCAAAAAQTPLTLTGPSGERQSYHLAELDSLPQISFETRTVWTSGEITFSGVSLAHLVDHAALDGEILRLTALNDYFVDLPVDDIGPQFPIVATRMDGLEMSVRNKGPYWLVYPYDMSDAYQTEVIFARSIWSLTEIMVIE